MSGGRRIRKRDCGTTLIDSIQGQGIDVGMLDAPHAGHFGLPGMRERAEQIGGQVEVWSKAGMGTEVALTIPGATVYASPRTRRHFRSSAGRRQAQS